MRSYPYVLSKQCPNIHHSSKKKKRDTKLKALPSPQAG